jgi:hypothetical protein
LAAEEFADAASKVWDARLHRSLGIAPRLFPDSDSFFENEMESDAERVALAGDAAVRIRTKRRDAWRDLFASSPQGVSEEPHVPRLDRCRAM